jgi:protein TonB
MAGSLINEWTNVVSEERNEIVFENRNKSYGAFLIRKEYTRTVMMALISTVAAIVLISVTPKIIELIKGSMEEKIVNVDITPVDLTAPPPIDETEPPPPPPPPPPVMETVKFTPPVVVDDPVVDDPPPPQETETQVSTVTQEGTDGDIIIPEEKGTGVVEAAKEEIFTVVEQMPEFPGGAAEMYKFISKNIQYPQIEKENGISGTVYVTFVVDKNGNINDVKSLRGVAGGPNLEKEALRVVKMMPAWKSGKQNGREVSVQFNLPIKFVLK